MFENKKMKIKKKEKRMRIWNKSVSSFIFYDVAGQLDLVLLARTPFFRCLSILELFFSLASLYTHTDGKNAHATERKGAQFRLFSLKLSKQIPICLFVFFHLILFFFSSPPLCQYHSFLSTCYDEPRSCYQATRAPFNTFKRC